MDTTTAPSPTPHRHHWVIETARGPVSPGTCKHCQARRDFANWLPETDFIGRDERNTPGAYAI